MSTSFAVRGMITALIPPFDEQGRLNPKLPERLFKFQIRAGEHGLGRGAKSLTLVGKA